MSRTTAPVSPDYVGQTDQIIADLGTTPDALLPILHAIQDRFGYLPEAALARIVQSTQITASAVTGVSTFYSRFRHQPAGKRLIRVCNGTACHVNGAPLIHDAVVHELKLAPGQDTDAEGNFTLERVGCIGCCTLAPVMQIDHHTFAHQSPQEVAQTIADYIADEEQRLRERARPRGKRTVVGPIEFRIACNSCCLAKGADQVKHNLEIAAAQSGVAASVKEVGCWGMCHQTPMVEVVGPAGRLGLYGNVEPAAAAQLVRRHLRPRGVLGRLRRIIPPPDAPVFELEKRDPVLSDFLGRQRRLATEFYGELDPLDLDEYLRRGGFAAARTALAASDPQSLIQTIRAAGLRGRGGAGFPTAEKWARTRSTPADLKYIICNGDEGDPGAFMNRMLLESFPFRVIEGMIVAALAVGAQEGILYIRHEYPLALSRIRAALPMCLERNLLGENLMGSQQTLRLRVVEGGGAFICGEETAMIASIEGQRGTPRLRPPYPAECGLWGKPTCINNVETLTLVPWIVRNGAAAFAAIGTASSKGTKTFALTGKVLRGGLIEVPMGITLRQIVEEIGGGVAKGRKFKAVQTGGPSGGCIPASMADLSVDYESLTAAGAIMGSGGLVVLDDADCMVDVARYFLEFTQGESCGKCSFCRIGTKVMLEILQKLCAGKAHAADLQKLESLCHQVKSGSLCGLGQTAPNPVLSTLRYFHDEYQAHVEGRCPAGRCKALIRYVVNEKCDGCTLCAQQCPAQAIPMTPYQRHEIDAVKCTRCDICRLACPQQAIDVTGLTPVKHGPLADG